jgi:hypothetical protein
MSAAQEEPIKAPPQDAATTDPRSTKVDPNAPAGSKNSLGQESVRDGRPTTNDSVVEAMDEETPVTPGLPDR